MYYLVCFVAILYILFDVNYFLRIVFTVLIGRFFEKKVKITDPTTIYGFCFTQDLDIAGRHMNNARFVRDLDFSRFHFYDRTGLYAQMQRLRTDAVQAATSIRYRRVMPIFTFYKIVSQLVYWEDKSFYVEQRFITPHDGFVRAIVLSKQTILKDETAAVFLKYTRPIDKQATADEMMQHLMGGEPIVRPEKPADLDLWMRSMDASSEKLRPHKD